MSSPSVIGVNWAEVDRPAAESEDATEDGPGTADEFPAMANRGNVNNNGTTDDMNWSEMGKEEVQYHLNEADKSAISAIDILSHY